jgi:tRNA (guanine37-N1)-methyltransferase
MRFSIITLFPDWITSACNPSIVGRAQKTGLIHIETVNPRDFTTDHYQKVDDAPYGGGVGMVMMSPPLLEAYESLLPLDLPSHTLLMSPWGKPLKQSMVQSYAQANQLVMICGHYEGIDARLLALIPDLELVSLGDFVLTGGEFPALCIVDAVTRLLPGALGKDASAQDESFADTGLLEYPQYTRPPQVRGVHVPDVLLSGNHQAIALWRTRMAEEITRRYRPDLL